MGGRSAHNASDAESCQAKMDDVVFSGVRSIIPSCESSCGLSEGSLQEGASPASDSQNCFGFALGFGLGLTVWGRYVHLKTGQTAVRSCRSIFGICCSWLKRRMSKISKDSRTSVIELHRPTIAPAMPARNERWERLLGYEHSSNRSKARLPLTQPNAQPLVALSRLT